MNIYVKFGLLVLVTNVYYHCFQLTSGEYIQMSGRAGRRGKDDKGIVIMMVDEKLNNSVVKNLVQVSFTWYAGVLESGLIGYDNVTKKLILFCVFVC